MDQGLLEQRNYLGNISSPLLVAAIVSAFQWSTDEVATPIVEGLGHIMAQKAIIYKVELSVSDMDRHNYDTHKLIIAEHPSETDEQLIARIVAFALNAHEYLEMTKGC